MPDPLSRRRVLTLFASAAAAVPISRALAEGADYEWTGTALGSEARLLFSGAAPARLRASVQRAVAEIDRLEDILSLFRDRSEMCRLNRDSRLADASLDLRQALSLALAVGRASGGLFDPTVQALWEAHTDWFAADRERGPLPDTALRAARSAVDFRRIVLNGSAIELGAGQRITLNGLGQGYVTDRVADLLRREGFVHVLVDLGEQRALGPRADGAPWSVLRAGAAPFTLSGGALATSEGRGCPFDARGTAHHLFDPRTGRSAHRWDAVTAQHGSAAVADALSTACYAGTASDIRAMLARFPGARVYAREAGGRERVFATAAPGLGAAPIQG